MNAECAGVTFAERLPEIVGWHQQRTVRLTRIVTEIGLILGGTTASRVLALLALGMSRQTLLSLIRRSCLLPSRPRWIGVDDWCWRRGVRYGTLIGLNLAKLLPGAIGTENNEEVAFFIILRASIFFLT